MGSCQKLAKRALMTENPVMVQIQGLVRGASRDVISLAQKRISSSREEKSLHNHSRVALLEYYHHLFQLSSGLFGVGTRERYLSLLEFREVGMRYTSSTMFTSKEPLVWRRNWRASARWTSLLRPNCNRISRMYRVSDRVMLPYPMKCLRSRIAEDLDLSHLTEKLMQVKGLASPLSSKEKLELWENIV